METPVNRQPVLIVPATVPDAQVTRVHPAEPDQRIVVSAVPLLVPAPTATPVIPEQLTAEQVAELLDESEGLRQELDRVRQR